VVLRAGNGERPKQTTGKALRKERGRHEGAAFSSLSVNSGPWALRQRAFSGPCCRGTARSTRVKQIASRRYVKLVAGSALPNKQSQTSPALSALSDGTLRDRLLDLIKNNDQSSPQKDIDGAILELCRRGERKSLLSDPRLVGNYNVAAREKNGHPPAAPFVEELVVCSSRREVCFNTYLALMLLSIL
jgi:hypothetical protein